MLCVLLAIACADQKSVPLNEQDGDGSRSIQLPRATLEPPRPTAPPATFWLTALPTAAVIEPRSGLDPGTLCNAQFAQAKVHALSAALNRKDAAAIEKMFPTTGRWAFGFSIGLPEIDRELRHGNLLGSDTGVRNGTELHRLLSRLSGIHFVFTRPLVGAADPEQGTASVGPVFWRASGAPFRAIGKDFVNGGGKIGVDCTTGLFVRVLLNA